MLKRLFLLAALLGGTGAAACVPQALKDYNFVVHYTAVLRVPGGCGAAYVRHVPVRGAPRTILVLPGRDVRVGMFLARLEYRDGDVWRPLRVR